MRHAVWADIRTTAAGDTYSLVYGRSVDDGQNWTTVTLVTAASSAGAYLRDPSIAVDGTTVYISYVAGESAVDAGVKLLKFTYDYSDNTIDAVSSAWVTKNTAEQFHYSDIAVDTTGYISIVSILNNVPRYYRSAEANGATFTEENIFASAPLTAARTSRPHMGVNTANNDVFLTFDAFDSGLTAGYVYVYKRNAVGWTRPIDLTSPADNVYQHTNLLVRNSKLYLVYVKKPTSGNHVLYSRIYDANSFDAIDNEMQVHTYPKIYTPALGLQGESLLIVYAVASNTASVPYRAYKASDKSNYTVATLRTHGDSVGAASIGLMYHLIPDVKYSQPDVLYMLKAAGGQSWSLYSSFLPAARDAYLYTNGVNNSYLTTKNILLPPNSTQWWSNDTAEIRFLITSNATNNVSLPDWTNWYSVETRIYTLNNGANYIYYQLRNHRGNTGPVVSFGNNPVYVGPGPSQTGVTESWTSAADRGMYEWAVPLSAEGYSVDGYYVYWGTDPNGETYATEKYQTTKRFDPPELTSDGIYYLRVAGKDISGQIGAWKTVLTYRYDHTAPAAVGTAAAIGSWTAVSDWGGMSWSAPGDTGGAGIKDYAYYWGVDPGGTSAVYITAASYNPPNISGGATSAVYYLRVAARDNALNVGPWKTLYTYRYDAVAPAATATTPADIWSRTNNPGAVTWAAVVDTGGSGTSGYNYYWGMDETGTPASWTTGTFYTPGTVSKEGSYYLRVQTKDTAGNTSAVKTARKWSFDRTAPGISTTNLVENWTSVNNRAVFTWEAAPDGEGSGIAGYNTRWLYGSDEKATSYVAANSYDPPGCNSGDGLYYLQTQAVDKVGLSGPWATVLTYRYDGSKPGQTGSAATQNWTNNNDVPETAWLEAADGVGSGVAGYNVYWGLNPAGEAQAYQTGRTYDPVSPNADGIYYLRVQAVDGVGLTGNWATVLTYQYDQTGPGISTTSITEGWTSVNSRSVLTWAEAPDGSSGIAGYYIYRGVDPAGESGDFLTKRQYDSPPISGDDRYFFRVQALDNAGNTGNWTTVYSYLYDTTPPGISPTGITEGWTSVNNRSVFSWAGAPDNLSGIGGYYCYWGLEPKGVSADYVTTAAYDPPVVTGNGVYYLNVRAVDLSGNPGDWTTVLTYKYDGVTPSGTAVISGGKTETRSKVIALFSVAEDTGSHVTSMNISETAVLNDWLPFATQHNYELKNTDTGDKTLTVWFADAAGNISAPSVATINYIGFAGADRAIIINDDSGYINTLNATLVIDVDTGATEMRLSDDATLSPWVSPSSVLPWVFSAGDGEKTVYVEYRDEAQDVWGTGVYSGTVTLDTVPPSQGRITINNGDKSVNSTLVNLALAAAGEPRALKLWNALDAEPADNQYIDYTQALEWTLEFLDGSQTVNVRFRDFAGNVSEIYSDAIYVDLASGGYRFVFNESDGDNDIASGNFKIRWTDSYRTDPLATIELSYSEIGGASGIISSNIPVTDLVNGLLWDCRGLPTGVYYLKALVSGDRGFFGVTSNYPILVFHDNSLPADPPAVLAVEPLTVITGNTGVTVSWQTGEAGAPVSVYYVRRAAAAGPGNSEISDAVRLQNRAELTLLAAGVTGNSFFWPAADLPSGNYYFYVEASNDYYSYGDFASGYIHILGHTPGGSGTGEKIWSFPNPFSPDSGQEARIAYRVDRDSWTKVYVYDIRGRQVWQRENYAQAGRDNVVLWDGRDGQGRLAANGLYILILASDKNKIIARGRLALHD